MAKVKEEIELVTGYESDVDNLIVVDSQVKESTERLNIFKTKLVVIAGTLLDQKKCKHLRIKGGTENKNITVMRKDLFTVDQSKIDQLKADMGDKFDASLDRTETISIKPEMLAIVFEKFTAAEREQFFVKDIKYKTKKGFDQVYLTLPDELKIKIGSAITWQKPAITIE